MQSRPRQPRLWLDLLPSELRTLIALRATKATQNDTAFALATVSPAMHSAISTLLNHTLTAGPITQHRFSSWLSLFARTLAHISCTHDLAQDLDDVIAVTNAFSFPNVSSIKISDHPILLLHLSRAMADNVCVVVRGYATKPTLLEALHSLPTSTALHLHFPSRPTAEPEHNDPWFWLFSQSNDPRSQASQLSKCLQNIRSLHLDCDWSTFRASSVWQVLPQLTSLQHLLVHNRHHHHRGKDAFMEVPPQAVAFMSQCRSVAISGCNTNRLAADVGVAVTRLYLWDICLDGSQLVQLSACVRLQCLRASVYMGSEPELGQLLRQLPELEFLDLSWRRKCHGCRHYLAVSEGEVAEAVTQGRKIRKLCLMEIIMDMTEVSSILEHFGSRLRGFEMRIRDQDETPVERLTLLLSCAVMYNTGLQSFLSRVYQEESEKNLLEGHVNWTTMKLARFLLEEIKRRAAGVEVTGLEGVLEALARPQTT